MSIGLKSEDILYIGRDLKNIIYNLMQKEKEKVESWLKKQSNDLRIKDILLATYLTKRIDYKYFHDITIKEELKTEQVEKKIEDIYGKIKCVNKIKLFICQVRKYFTPGRDSYKICNFIEDILKREEKINFDYLFREDYAKIINSWHPNRNGVSKEEMFLRSNHIGLYLYYSILKEWKWMTLDFIYHMNKSVEIKVYSDIRNKIIENLYRHTIDDIDIKLDLYLNKIESNNFPCEEIKEEITKELIIELVNMMENNFGKIAEYFRDISRIEKTKIARKVVIENIDLFKDKPRSQLLFDLLNISTKSFNVPI